MTQGANSTPFAIDASGVYTFAVGPGLQMYQNGVVNDLSFRIDADQAVSAIALNREGFTTDQANLLDVEALGRDYVVLTYPGINGGSQMSVTAAEDGTEVEITAPVAINGNAANTPFTVTLNKGESIYYQADGADDLSGTRVNASKDVAVFAGVECANVPTSAYACDHIVSQQYSTDNFDTEFLISNSYGNNPALGDLVRVIGDTDNTEVFLNGVSVGTIDAGQVLEIDAGLGGVLTATEPVTLGQYLRGQSQRQAGIGDPAYEIIPSIDQLLSAYAFTTPVGVDAFSLNYLSLGIKVADAGSLLLNGALVDTTLFQSISGWLFGTVSIGLGYGTIEADNPFLATISGYSDYDSYFSTIATSFSPGVSPPPPSTIPLPAGLLLLAPALGLLAAVRRRKS